MAGASLRLAAAFTLALAVVTIARAARAHAVGLSRGEYTLVGHVVAGELTFARADVDGLDASSLLRGIIVSADGKRCGGVPDSMTPVEPAAIALRARFVCADARGTLETRIALFDELPEGHRHSLHMKAGARAVDDVLYRSHDAASLPIEQETASGARSGAVDETARCPLTSSRRARLLGMLRMGVAHILSGYDHLVFLFALVVVGGRRRALLAVVTAFTVAHSMTLAIAALGIWIPPARLIEPAIALSIAYVGVENFLVPTADKRWRITFPFGLLHGFGFAAALRDVALPRAEVPLALLSFNLGVELGQLTVLAALLPLLAWLRSSTVPANGGVVRAASVAVVLVGVFWFVARLLHAPA